MLVLMGGLVVVLVRRHQMIRHSMVRELQVKGTGVDWPDSLETRVTRMLLAAVAAQVVLVVMGWTITTVVTGVWVLSFQLPAQPLITQVAAGVVRLVPSQVHKGLVA